MTGASESPILTLEPLIDAVRTGVERAGWTLSGLQKTTSHEFEGRWEGESSRSAYLFFHRSSAPEWASVDVFLDETSSGLAGNLALVVELRPLRELGDVPELLATLRRLADDTLPPEYRTPVTLRFRLEKVQRDPTTATSEARFKLHIPSDAVRTGSRAVTGLASAGVTAFGRLLDDPSLRGLCPDE